MLFNPLPNDQILDMTKLKAFADDKLNVDKMTTSLIDREENTEFHSVFQGLFPWGR